MQVRRLHHYIESDTSSILEQGDTMTKQFVYMLDYNNSLEFDQREDDYAYRDTPEDSFT